MTNSADNSDGYIGAVLPPETGTGADTTGETTFTEESTSTPEERMAVLEDDESEAFSELMHFCMQSRSGKKPRRRLLGAVVGMDGPTYDDLETATGRSKRQIRRQLGELREAGVVETQGRGNTTFVLFAGWKMEVLAKRALTLTD